MPNGMAPAPAANLVTSATSSLNTGVSTDTTPLMQTGSGNEVSRPSSTSSSVGTSNRPRTTSNPSGSSSFWTKWIIRGLGAMALTTSTAPTTSRSSSGSGSTSSPPTTSANDRAMTSPHPLTTSQRTWLQQTLDRAGGASSTSSPPLTTAQEEPTPDYNQQGARSKTTKQQRKQNEQGRRNKRWAERQNRKEAHCGGSSSLLKVREKVNSGRANATDLSLLGNFHRCRGDYYDLQAAHMGDPAAAWRYAESLLGLMGPELQPSQEALQAIASARLLGSTQAAKWADQYITYQMRHAQAFMTQGSFDANQPLSQAGQYTEDSLSFLTNAAWAGFGHAQAAAAWLSLSLNNLQDAWNMIQLLFENNAFLSSSLGSGDIGLILKLIEMTEAILHSYQNYGITEEQMRLIVQVMRDFKASHSS